jgi:uncharacterized protein with HEPN domain
VKSDRIYLLHIRDAINRVGQYIAPGRPAFLWSHMIQDAVVRNLEVISEAVNNLSEQLKDGHEDIPWKQIAGMRDKMIHEYFGVNLELVWRAAETELPSLKLAVESILSELDENP